MITEEASSHCGIGSSYVCYFMFFKLVFKVFSKQPIELLFLRDLGPSNLKFGILQLLFIDHIDSVSDILEGFFHSDMSTFLLILGSTSPGRFELDSNFINPSLVLD
mmetsp:Transcript_13105/g.11583  ORF Transcript_13105/g.11583 Transcript_13105/m.11583 type:complete len:106 (+) Transcript_13105:356-673(+)